MYNLQEEELLTIQEKILNHYLLDEDLAIREANATSPAVADRIARRRDALLIELLDELAQEDNFAMLVDSEQMIYDNEPQGVRLYFITGKSLLLPKKLLIQDRIYLLQDTLVEENLKLNTYLLLEEEGN